MKKNDGESAAVNNKRSGPGTGRAAAVLLFIVLLVIAREGNVSQIVLNPVSPDDVLRDSSCVVLAKKADPFIQKEEISITPQSGPAGGKDYPPFTKITYRFIVLEVLYSDKDISPGQVIQVVSPSQQHRFVMHQAYYLGGPVPSVNVPSYQTPVNLDAINELVAFLRSSDYSSFTFTAENAFESTSKKSEIMSRLKKRGGKQ